MLVTYRNTSRIIYKFNGVLGFIQPLLIDKSEISFCYVFTSSTREIFLCAYVRFRH